MDTEPSQTQLASSIGPPRRRSIKTWTWRIAALAAIGGSLAFTREPLLAIAVLFVLVVPFEKMFPRHKGQRVRREAVGTDIAHALMTPFTGVLTIAVALPIAVASLIWIPALIARPFVAMIPGGMAPIAGILLFDLTIYWVHRWSHEVGFLWKFHAIHHSTKTLDWVSGFRNHPMEAAILAPPFVFLVVAGFSAEFAGALAIIQIVTGLFLHANVRWRLRPLHRIVITPEFHHWHHSNDAGAHNSNYSVFLPIWDIVFGTCFIPADRRPQTYGVNEYIPDGVMAQLMHPLRGMRNPISVLRHPLRSTRDGYRFSRGLLGQVWATSRRPTQNVMP